MQSTKAKINNKMEMDKKEKGKIFKTPNNKRKKHKIIGVNIFEKMNPRSKKFLKIKKIKGKENNPRIKIVSHQIKIN